MAAPAPKGVHIPNPVGPVVHGAEGVVKGVESGIKTTAAINSFLFDPIRIGEALVGLMLIGVGVNAMLRGGSVVQATRKSGKTAIEVGTLVATKGKKSA